MFKVMIVDDEALFRQHMRERIDWESIGLTISCEANNGIVAIEQAKQNRPDLALVDISMPHMDGLELAEQLKQKYPKMFIILVTGHNEFEYARKAMRIGVSDYLLKPFDNDEFMVALQKAKSFIESSREENELPNNYVPLLRESFLNNLIGRDLVTSQEQIELSLRRFHMPIPPLAFRVVVTEIDHLYEKWSNPSEIILWKHTVANMLQDLIKIEGVKYVFNDSEGHIVSVLGFQHKQDLATYNGYAFEKLGRLVERHFKFTVTVGFGSKGYGYKHLHRSYREALLCVQNKLTAGQGNLIWYDQLNNRPEKFNFFPIDLHESLIFQLRAKDWVGVKEALESAFSYLSKDGVTLESAHTIMFGLISVCLSFTIESGYSIEDMFGTGFSPGQHMQKLSSIQQAESWIVSLFEKVAKASSGPRLSKSLKLYNATRSYIQEHYINSELSVEGIATHFFIDSSYLRKIFRREGEISVSDYITYVRMQKAKELIGGGAVKLLGVSDLVGYNDPNYFSKCFKKQFGLTPSEYENRLAINR
ncbi:response regulator [Cohnella sp. WQ 127256]|uniref:response regulator n=1 Tax=Cohnella sp. WQ 127256 TaxID=2938790 RepID=UPI002118C2E7|nr:response regulator [Cohnella sp. WQ 127256]